MCGPRKGLCLRKEKRCGFYSPGVVSALVGHLLHLLELQPSASRAEQADVEAQQHDQDRRAGEHGHRPECRERRYGDYGITVEVALDKE